MESTVLTTEQQQALTLFGANPQLNEIFYLTGGTALAGFYLHHRYSDDLDFFTNQHEFPQLEVEQFVQKIKGSLDMASVEYRRLFDRRIFFLKKNGHELKIEFTAYPFAQLYPPRVETNVRIDSLRDIAANKIMTIFDRIEIKDYVDVYFILNNTNDLSLSGLLELVKQKFGLNIDPLAMGSELAKIKSITTMPRLIKEISLEELKDFFSQEAKKLRPQILEG